MTAGDGKVAIRRSLRSQDGTDNFGAVLPILEESRTAHRPWPSNRRVDITSCLFCELSAFHSVCELAVLFSAFVQVYGQCLFSVFIPV